MNEFEELLRKTLLGLQIFAVPADDTEYFVALLEYAFGDALNPPNVEDYEL